MREVICEPDEDQCKLAPPSMSSDGLFASGGTSGLSPGQPSYLVPLSRSVAHHGKARRKKRSPVKGGGRKKKKTVKRRIGKALKRLIGGSRVKKRCKPGQKRKCVKKTGPKRKKSA